jgi:hypothetical protein
MFEPNTPSQPQQTNSLNQTTPTTDSILDDNTSDIKTTPKKAKISPLSLILITLTLGLTAFGVYLQLEINAANNSIQATQTAIEAQAQNIITEDNQEVTLSTKKVFLDLKSNQRTFFKNIIQDINQDIINTTNFNTQSYSINPQGQISLNLNSTPLNLNPLNQAAILIDKLENRTYFQNVFIPGITQSLTESGLEQVQFNLQLTHNSLSPSNQIPPDTSPEDSVPNQEENEEDGDSTTERPSPILN